MSDWIAASFKRAPGSWYLSVGAAALLGAPMLLHVLFGFWR